VKEAIRYTDDAIVQARRRGSAEVRLIVGKGLHSAGHVAKIKPAIEELMQKSVSPACLIVRLCADCSR
jgi:DNA-nicking Smr family endonuclease